MESCDHFSRLNKMAGNSKVVISYVAVIVTFLAVVSSAADDPKRQLITIFNPDCSEKNNCSCGPGVAYIKAVGGSDILHYVVSAIGGPPTVLIVRTNKPKNSDVDDDSLQIDCKKMTESISPAISLPKALKEMYSFGLVFTRLFQYNDTTDKADITKYTINSTAWRVYDFVDFDWVPLEDESSDYLIKLKVKSSGDVRGRQIVNGSFVLQFHLFDHEDRSERLPRLLNNENGTEFDLILQNIDTGNNSAARWAVETVVLSRDSIKNSMKINTEKSIDDEYTPGVFSINSWYTKPGDMKNGGYLQWKPICYSKPGRDRADGTLVKHYTMRDTKYVSEFLSKSVAHSYFTDLNSILMKANNFSFGLEKDGGFTKTNFTAWTAQIGLGEPPEDAISSLVIVVISVGLGLPVVIILFGGLFILIKKKVNGGSSYDQLNGVDNISPQIQ